MPHDVRDQYDKIFVIGDEVVEVITAELRRRPGVAENAVSIELERFLGEEVGLHLASQGYFAGHLIQTGVFECRPRDSEKRRPEILALPGRVIGRRLMQTDGAPTTAADEQRKIRRVQVRVFSSELSLAVENDLQLVSQLSSIFLYVYFSPWPSDLAKGLDLAGLRLEVDEQPGVRPP
ncbi:MAG: hypothetical protein BWY66_00057 [bacterium ADurb.Bin374]|nr:MAG: hypothetical protein BWY66_00057 [bacterium ADurb.Bin374]